MIAARTPIRDVTHCHIGSLALSHKHTYASAVRLNRIFRRQAIAPKMARACATPVEEGRKAVEMLVAGAAASSPAPKEMPSAEPKRKRIHPPAGKVARGP